jgi:hypothetical protein
VLAVGLLLAPSVAEARFGKRSSGGDSDEKKEKKKDKEEKKEERRESSKRTHEATPVGRSSWGRVHDATAVGQPSRDDDDDDDSPPPPRREVVVVAPSPAPIYARPVMAARVERRAHGTRLPLMLRLGAEGQAFEEGGAAAQLSMGLEGRRWGVDLRMTSIKLPTDDGTEGTDEIQLLGAHLTWASWTHDRGRLRLEGGVGTAHAPDVTFVGPSVAVSFERCLVGALDVEGRLQLIPFPHQQADIQGGLAVHMGTLSLRAGWRGLYLNDRGHVDGETHEDTLRGPYFGLGLSF